jgi:dienelactone hydrolase
LRNDDRVQLRERIQAAVDALKAQAGKAPLQPGKVGAVGFCFGGSTVLELARSGVDGIAGVVSLHGGITPGAKAATAAHISAPVLVLNGAADKSVTPEAIGALGQELDTAGADWQFVNFSGAVHCFAEADSGNDPSTGCAYDARAAKRAYLMMNNFFGEVFRK